MADRATPLDVNRLVAEYHQPLYRYAFRLTGSSADAEDLVQQVFLVAQQKLDQVRQCECVRSWLYAVLRNGYLKSHRKRQPVLATSLELDINSIPEEASEQEIDPAELQAAINSLDDEFKLVLLLFYFEYRSYREIATELDIPLGTVMSRLARAKAHLRRLLGAPESRNTQTPIPPNSPAEKIPAPFAHTHQPTAGQS